MLDNCKGCGIKRDDKTFYQNRWSNFCRSCTNKDNKDRRDSNKEEYLEKEKVRRENQDKDKVKEYQNKYRKDNVEKIYQLGVEYRAKNKESIKEGKRKYTSKRRAEDPMYKLIGNVRSLIKNTFLSKGFKKAKKTEEILGCSINFFIEYLSAQFTDEMTLNNHGSCKEEGCLRYWELDHIYPVSKAKTNEHLIELNHYTNFRPLWQEDNMKKFDRIESIQLRLL